MAFLHYTAHFYFTVFTARVTLIMDNVFCGVFFWFFVFIFRNNRWLDFDVGGSFFVSPVTFRDDTPFVLQLSQLFGAF